MLKLGSSIGASILILITAACSGGDASSTETGSDASGIEQLATYASLTGDPKTGESAYMQCRTCHVLDEGVNLVGPSLHNIVGAEAGSVAGFKYSPANASSGITWTEEKLFAYLEDPKAVIPGTTMSYSGMPDAQKRADVIAYLKNPS